MEEFKKKGYYPAGGRSQTSSAGSITYINTDSGLTAGNVQDAIDELLSDINNIFELGEDYIKFNNGLLVIWKYMNIDIVTSDWTAFGSWVYCHKMLDFEYPIPFISPPAVLGSTKWPDAPVSSVYTQYNKLEYVDFARPTSFNGTLTFSFVAVGYWK